ncbi:hypothetical protein NPX13_g1035 [Xylaria arbuscula]|uniref:Uncharacterized protein n=1 Tax=Xylaria arbuscula TaxID=114810 RepID=A0A9W8NMV5_9PEZI|nr:hypothetical protein NPX13_g1035 [Xylaria arbuscula]
MSRRNSTSSNTPSESLSSVLSDDSYIVKLEQDLDDTFKDILASVETPASQRSIMKERRIQSHIIKRRDPNDVGSETWSDEMKADHKAYKGKVNDLAKAAKTQKMSRKIGRETKKDDLATYEAVCNTALSDAREWARLGIEAGTARLNFLTKYPDAFDTEGHRKHLIQAQANLDSAKLAYRECHSLQERIDTARRFEAIREARRRN